MMYADNSDYREFLGESPFSSPLPLELFERYAVRASVYMDGVTQNRITEVTENIKLCCIELAVEMYKQSQSGGVKQSENIGGYGYTLANPKSADSTLYAVCKLWLPPELLYRGKRYAG
jgi:hypothetical protein